MADKKSPWARGGSGGGNTGGTGGGGVGPGGSGGSKRPGPDYERIIREQQERMRQFFGQGHEKRAMWMAVVGVLALWVASGVYRVNSDELGVVMRFGHFNRVTTPGLNYRLPAPIEKVIIPSVTTVNKVEIGRNGSAAENPRVRAARSFGATAVPQLREGQMLTGDRNIVDVDFEVQWKIDAAAPEKFLFNVRDPAANVKAVAESAMREVISRNKLDDILTSAQSQIAEDVKSIMQQTFDRYDAGVEVIAVNLSRPDVPQPVIDEFQDVKRAEQDKQTAESVAEGYANEIIPKARGEAAKMIQDAEAYKSQVVADAQGDASRYSQIYAQYAQAKDVTKKRMYLETMETVLKGMTKVIVDPNARGAGGMVQWLPTPPKAATEGK